MVVTPLCAVGVARLLSPSWCPGPPGNAESGGDGEPEAGGRLLVRVGALVLISTLLLGCATGGRRQDPPSATTPSPGEHTDRGGHPPPRSPCDPELETEVSEPVRALLSTCRDYLARGEYEAAGEVVERALDLEPMNPVVWYRLARIRTSQGQLEQSVTLASKSLSLIRSDESLRARNWDLLSTVYRLQGRGDKAREARQRYRDVLRGR